MNTAHIPQLQVLIDGAYGKFGYNTDLKCIFHLWKGFLSLEEVKYVAETTNPVLATHGISNLIADHREMEMFNEEVSAYISNVWLPELEKLGVKTTFVVLSSNVFTHLSAEETHENAKEHSQIEIRHFDSMEKAVKAIEDYNRTQVNKSILA